MSVIEVSHLTKDYGSGRGVFDVSFAVERGEVFGFLGPNGAGKSTTIRHLMGFSRPQEGDTKIFGKSTFSHYDRILSDVGYIPGEIALPAGLTGWEFLSMMQSLQHKKNQEQLDRMLSMFRLEDKALRGDTKHMSLGVKRKLAVVSAFMNDPSVLILDEPTSGLDPVMQEVFVDFIKEEKARGKTILLSSHIFSEVDATCDRIAIIKDGRIVSEFVADDLRHANKKIYRIRFSDRAELARFLEAAKSQTDSFTVDRSDPDTATAVILTEDAHINGVVNCLADFAVVEFVHRKETLEDYFMKFYKEDGDFGGAIQ